MNLNIQMEKLLSLHRFGDMFEKSILSINNDNFEIKPVREAKDCIGRHWYGMRVAVKSKVNGQNFYLHTGLIFLPETKVGFMVEVDKNNNLQSYQLLWDGIENGKLFNVNRAEEEYLKLFLNDEKFAELMELFPQKQIELMATYIEECVEEIVRVEAEKGFALSIESLLDIYKMGVSFETVLESLSSENYSIELNKKDPDNFGQYASGYRFWLSDAKKNVSMYAYFGAIYSYKKRPCGIFAEIDKFSNPNSFDTARKNMKQAQEYEYSQAEPDFIKLFMKEEDLNKLNTLNEKDQLELLSKFVDNCCTKLVEAAIEM